MKFKEEGRRSREGEAENEKRKIARRREENENKRGGRREKKGNRLGLPNRGEIESWLGWVKSHRELVEREDMGVME